MVAVLLESDLWLWVLRRSESESVYFPAALVRLSAMCLRANWNFSTPPSWPPDVKRQLTGKDPDAEKDWGQEKKGVRVDEMVGCITKSMDVNLSKLQEIVKDRGAWPAVVHGSRRVRYDLATELQLHHQLRTAQHLPFLYCWQFLCKPRALFSQTA